MQLVRAFCVLFCVCHIVHLYNLFSLLTISSFCTGANAEDRCRECVGTGVVPCDMCGGTGLWRVLSRKRANSTYEFVECPQCMSRGVKVCGVCFGSGLRNVRGLLRRPESTGLVLRMQHGELKPGQCLLLLIPGTPTQTHLLKSGLAAYCSV